MKFIHNFFLLLIIVLAFSCSKKEENKLIIKEKDLELQMIDSYKQGVQALDIGDGITAARKFNEAELLFPQSEWAPKSALMAAYSYYIQDYYADSMAELERFIKIYSNHKDLDYAYYLLALCYYEQIVDEKKDLNSILKSKEIFEILIKKYPNSEYSMDANFKMDLINDILASKDMYIGRYYVDKKKWISAINRFRSVVDNYDRSIYTEEALYRLVEIYYLIGLTNEAKKYAQLLGYNYQSSEWYEKSYAMFDKTYIENKKLLASQNKKSNFVIRKFKSLFD